MRLIMLVIGNRSVAVRDERLDFLIHFIDVVLNLVAVRFLDLRPCLSVRRSLDKAIAGVDSLVKVGGETVALVHDDVICLSQL